MRGRYVSIFCAGLAVAISTSADIVWSGEQYQRAYHDIPSLDFNQDGTNDFTFNLTISLDTYYDYSIEPASGGVVVEQRTHTQDSVALAEGILISSTLDNPGLEFGLVWKNSDTYLFGYAEINDNPDYGGGFADTEGYLGVSFEVDGATHYGWIETSHSRSRLSPDDQYLYIHSWAYESAPDTAITAGAIPEPSTGLLAMIGSISLLMYARFRRRGGGISKRY